MTRKFENKIPSICKDCPCYDPYFYSGRDKCHALMILLCQKFSRINKELKRDEVLNKIIEEEVNGENN